jgi:hypothetical protein
MTKLGGHLSSDNSLVWARLGCPAMAWNNDKNTGGNSGENNGGIVIGIMIRE